MSGPERLPFLDAEPWRVVVINPTGRYARNQVAGLVGTGTPVVAGVALGRGGETMDGLPLYDRVADLPAKANIAVLYTPAEGVRDAIAECAAAHIRTIVAVAEYVPVHDAIEAAARARAAGSWLVGPNTLGIYVPGRGLIGSIAPSFCRPGRVAMIVRSGTLALAMVRQLTLAGIGQTLVAHIGGDAVIGRNPHEYLAALAHHPGNRSGAVLRRDRRRQGVRVRGRRQLVPEARGRDGGRPSCARGEEDGPCRRARRQRARGRSGQARGARGRRVPDRGRPRRGGRHLDRAWSRRAFRC